MQEMINQLQSCICFSDQVDKVEESFDIINSGTKPLAAYLFTSNEKLKKLFVLTVSAGGLVVNDTTLHVIFFLESLTQTMFTCTKLFPCIYAHNRTQSSVNEGKTAHGVVEYENGSITRIDISLV